MLDTEKINALAKKLGFTNQQLAEACGVSPAMMSYIRNGLRNPDLGIAANLANALGTTVDELLRKS